ncbi:hypothetical protein [Thiohalocapsa sp. ML1]|uniref:hypothetical protein n=1 Tax=Thiohalocapsa sp. ML1 TaxID=1431688 RepID=UPI0012E39C16|nr:hypothetical protein [Thiohalocapsa sp. ML1]
MPNPPAAPTRTSIPTGNSALAKLLDNVKDALRAIPVYYESGTHIEGLEAVDLFNLNSVLGSSIEIQVVDTLNRVRKVWDPDDEWPEHNFERSSQTFPDVRLISRTGGEINTVLGVELKGWYLLAKEGVPSFRYKVTPAACSEYDLLVVVPWHLKNVLSGIPIVYEPYIEQARFVAQYRNFWWKHMRNSAGNTTINPPPGVIQPYPPPKSKVNDSPSSDSGGNFGRVARIGVMDTYIDRMLSHRVSGVEANHWVLFFKTYAESNNSARITEKLENELARMRQEANSDSDLRLLDLLAEIGNLWCTR